MAALHLPECFEAYHSKTTYHDNIFGKYILSTLCVKNPKIKFPTIIF
jgi:hypothetical protein